MLSNIPFHVFYIPGIMAGLIGLIAYILITEFIKDLRDNGGTLVLPHGILKVIQP